MQQTQQVTDLVKGDGLDVESARGPINPSAFLVIEVTRYRETAHDDRAPRREVSVSKDTSHHAMVWICRLPPFDKDVRVGVPIVVVVIVIVVDLCLVER